MDIINNRKIYAELEKKIDNSPVRIQEILTKAKEMKGIDENEALTLLQTNDPELVEEIYKTAEWIKQTIYGNRLVVFAPLYVSNLCNNECSYCAFRVSNTELVRKSLGQNQIAIETERLIADGHKRVLLVAGESFPKEGLDYIFKSIETVYSVQKSKGNIRRLNVNIAPLSTDQFKELKKYNIGTYQVFQETYHKETYEKLHTKGPKSNYQYRLEAMDRAMEAGIDDVGVGILFGLYDWKYEILALMSHIRHLENRFGVGPHTISVPRIEEACGSSLSQKPPFQVNDNDFKKIISVIRLAVPYTGIILSTRETPQMRREALRLGISQISAGAKTNPGGYEEHSKNTFTEEQFSLGDTRSLHEVIQDIVKLNHIPSFCTGCYRLGRVGKDFMDLAKPGLIKSHCLPNALFTFAEYLQDFADPKLKESGQLLINNMINSEISDQSLQNKVKVNIEKIVHQNVRDIYL